MTLQNKIDNKTAQVGIIGGGYVGLPLAVEFAKAGFPVTVFDIDERKVQAITVGRSYIPDVSTDDVTNLTVTKRLSATTKFGLLADMDVAIICVPTPLKKTKDPDIRFIVAACESIAKYLHAEMFISLESSTYPGTTDELMLPMFTERGYEVGRDFYLCFSPERVDPGNKKWHTRNIPKVIGGITPACTAMGERLYSHAVDKVIPVDGTKAAEMVKLLENTFRMVNIGLVNELAVECDRMGINIWDVIEAAKTKPFGYMPFYPGIPGGHCIPIDPFYFSWKSKQYGSESRFIETAGHVNNFMPHYVVEKIQDALNIDKKPINNSHILLVGMSYKKNVDDVRESSAVDIALLLMKKGAIVKYHDPFVESCRINGIILKSCPLIATVRQADCVVITTDHDCISYDDIYKNSTLIIDPKNALSRTLYPPMNQNGHCVLYKYLHEKADNHSWNQN